MARITYETPGGENTINAVDISYDESRAAWLVDLGRGGSGNISDVGTNIQQVVVPENRVYRVEYTDSEKI
ncbi:hypothetical protein [Halorarum halobium]|uniref:hypothetical protein n=1 Tax=Halorarum halobium TaxID=3075121 RepID=UPI0028A97405|nr:hypothetical protein [Halobaculum sp. XH14]